MDLRIFLMICYVSHVFSQNECRTTTKIGDISTDSENKNINGNADTTVIILDQGRGSTHSPPEGTTTHRIDCCGVLTEWRINIMATNNDPIKLQIWRPPQTGNSFLLVGETEYIPPGNNRYYVPASDTVYVQPGDRLGFTGHSLEWASSTTYDRALQGDVLSADGLGTSPGGVYALTNQHPYSNADDKMIGWAFEAYLDRRDDPDCTLLLTTTTIAEDTPIGTSIGRVITTLEVDQSLPGYDFSLIGNGGLPLTIDPATGAITTTGALEPNPLSQEYMIAGRTTEKICSKFGRCSDKLTVTWINQPISISNLPANTDLIESTEVTTTLITIETADANRDRGDDTSATCSIITTSPLNGPFTLTRHADMTKYILKYDASQRLYSKYPTHLILVSCEDGYKSTTTGTFTLTVTDNATPVVNTAASAGGEICNTASAMLTKKNDVVFTLIISDAEGDAILTTFSKIDSSSPFAWNSGTYQIYATRDLLDMLDDYHQFTLQVWDKWNIPGTTYRLCIRLTDLNVIPIFDNCPTDVTYPEYTANGTVVFTVGATDANKITASQTFTFAMDVVPTNFKSSYDLNSVNGDIGVTGTTIADDYNAFVDIVGVGGRVTLTLSVTDGIHYALENCTLTLGVRNVNDAPQFNMTTMTLNMDEQRNLGDLTENLPFTDKDSPDTHTFDIASGNVGSIFSIDEKTGTISLAKTCDIDFGCPKQFNLLIEVKDASHAADLMEVIITVNDINDNPPAFTSNEYAVSLSPGTLSGSGVIQSMRATDPDSGTNSDLTYSIAGIGYGAEYFTVDSSGDVRLMKPLDHPVDQTYYITICARDKGAQPLETCASLLVTYTIPTTTQIIITSERPMPCFFCTEKGIAIFTVTMFLAAIALICACIPLCQRLMASRICQRSFWHRSRVRKPLIPMAPRPPRQLPSWPKPKPRLFKEQKVERFGFWNEGDQELHGTNPRPSRVT